MVEVVCVNAGLSGASLLNPPGTPAASGWLSFSSCRDSDLVLGPFPSRSNSSNVDSTSVKLTDTLTSVLTLPQPTIADNIC